MPTPDPVRDHLIALLRHDPDVRAALGDAVRAVLAEPGVEAWLRKVVGR